MKTPKLIVSSIAALILLSGCSEAQSTPQPSEVGKEAGVRGTRICFANETKLPISVAPSDFVNQPNADHIVGKAGAVTPGSELCFAGWNSYLVPLFQPGDGSYSNAVQDVVVSVNINGAYNVLFFKSKNVLFFPATIQYSTELYSKNWPGFGSGADAKSWSFTAAGHTFIETYRDDSEYYKEFLVTFTQ